MRRLHVAALSVLLFAAAIIAPKSPNPDVQQTPSAQAISTPEDSWWLEQRRLNSLRASRNAQRVVPSVKPTPPKHVAPKTRTHKSTTTRSSTGTALGATAGSVWYRLAGCESGHNPRAVSPNGLYFGLYQFSLSTWRSVGGTGNPINASEAEQTKRAKILQRRSGFRSQWPACSRKLGLR